jgi:hypothetical protein
MNGVRSSAPVEAIERKLAQVSPIVLLSALQICCFIRKQRCQQAKTFSPG